MASTEMSNEDIDRMFDAITRAVLGLTSMAEAAQVAASAMGEFGIASTTQEEWPDTVLEDILDAEVIGE